MTRTYLYQIRNQSLEEDQHYALRGWINQKLTDMNDVTIPINHNIAIMSVFDLQDVTSD